VLQWCVLQRPLTLVRDAEDQAALAEREARDRVVGIS
jgi:hypothetical protein